MYFDTAKYLFAEESTVQGGEDSICGQAGPHYPCCRFSVCKSVLHGEVAARCRLELWRQDVAKRCFFQRSHRETMALRRWRADWTRLSDPCLTVVLLCRCHAVMTD